MEGVTDKLTNYQQIVPRLLMGYVESKPAYGDNERGDSTRVISTICRN